MHPHTLKEGDKIFDIFKTSDCLYFPPNNYSALKRWMAEDPVYNPCTVGGEMCMYLFVVVIALIATVVILTKKCRKAEKSRQGSNKNAKAGADGVAVPVEMVAVESDSLIESNYDENDNKNPSNELVPNELPSKGLAIANVKIKGTRARWPTMRAQAGLDKSHTKYYGNVNANAKETATNDGPIGKTGVSKTGVSENPKKESDDSWLRTANDDGTTANDEGGEIAAEEEKEEIAAEEEEEEDETPRQALAFRLLMTLIFVPLLAYVFLVLVVGLGVMPNMIFSITMAKGRIKCQHVGLKRILNYQPVAYKLKHEAYDLAIMKLERNKTGYLAHLNRTMIFTYGKGGSVNQFMSNFSDYAENGMEIYIWDLPGSGFSDGPRSPDDFVAALQIVRKFAAEQTGKSIEDILLLGYSLGGFITQATAAKSSGKADDRCHGIPKKVILLQPLDALSNVVIDGCKMTGMFGGPVIGRDYLDARSSLVHYSRCGGCLLLFASRQDHHIRFKRHRDTFLRFYENSQTQCGVMVVDDHGDHLANPWLNSRFKPAFKKFLAN